MEAVSGNLLHKATRLRARRVGATFPISSAMDVDIDTEPAVVVPEMHVPETHAEDALVPAEAAEEPAAIAESTEAPSAERAKSRAARPNAGAQNGVSVFPVARVSKIIKVRTYDD